MNLNLRIFNKSIGNLLFEKISFNFLDSNHPERVSFYKQYKSITNFKKLRLNNSKNSSNLDFYFIGDSHVEIFSRPDIYVYKNQPNNIKAIWLGPRTILGMKYEFQYDKLFKQINEKINLNKNKKILIFSFGSIDIRYFFYEIEKRFLNDSNDNLLKVFEEACLDMLNELILKFKKDLSVVNIGLCEIPPSLTNGKLPETASEFKDDKKENKVPTFGTLEQRQKWTVDANKILKSLAKKNNIEWIKTSSFHNEKWTQKQSSDGIHITNSKINQEIKNHIFRKMLI